MSATFGRTANWVSLVSGVYMILAPFLFGFTNQTQEAWNSLLLGIIVSVLAVYRMTSPGLHIWTATVSLVLGLWAIVAPFALGAGNVMAAVWSGVIAGAAVAVFSVASMSGGEAIRERPERMWES